MVTSTHQIGSSSGTGLSPLSKREVEVLELVARGAKYRKIARQLEISEQTVKHHICSIYAKLGVGDRTSAVLCAIRQGTIQVEGIRAEARAQW
jgi:DNA-binding NarL/FixJ family response regulator